MTKSFRVQIILKSSGKSKPTFLKHLYTEFKKVSRTSGASTASISAARGMNSASLGGGELPKVGKETN